MIAVGIWRSAVDRPWRSSWRSSWRSLFDPSFQLANVLLEQHTVEIRHFGLDVGHRDRHLAALGVLVPGRMMSSGQVPAGT